MLKIPILHHKPPVVEGQSDRAQHSLYMNKNEILMILKTWEAYSICDYTRIKTDNKKTQDADLKAFERETGQEILDSIVTNLTSLMKRKGEGQSIKNIHNVIDQAKNKMIQDQYTPFMDNFAYAQIPVSRKPIRYDVQMSAYNKSIALIFLIYHLRGLRPMMERVEKSFKSPPQTCQDIKEYLNIISQSIDVIDFLGREVWKLTPEQITRLQNIVIAQDVSDLDFIDTTDISLKIYNVEHFLVTYHNRPQITTCGVLLPELLTQSLQSPAPVVKQKLKMKLAK